MPATKSRWVITIKPELPKLKMSETDGELNLLRIGIPGPSHVNPLYLALDFLNYLVISRGIENLVNEGLFLWANIVRSSYLALLNRVTHTLRIIRVF